MKRCGACQQLKPHSEFYRKDGGKSLAYQCKKCHVAKGVARDRAARKNLPPSPGKASASSDAKSADGQSSWSESGDTADLVQPVSGPIRTLEELVRVCKIDAEIWEVEKYECTAWTVAMKISGGEGQPDQTTQQQNYRVWARLKRRIPKRTERVADLLIQRMKAYRPTFKPVLRNVVAKSPHMLCVALHDSHFGKLAWKAETGQTYNLAEAEEVYQRAVEDLVARAGPERIEQILFPIGHDFFNVDNLQRTTANGTPQELDGNYVQMFVAGQEAARRAVNYLANIAPVHVMVVPGNHDRLSSWHLGNYLDAFYRDRADVTVDNLPRPRKYYRYGTTLIGGTHGDNERHASLPTIMATEVPDLWACTTHREWHLGHLHKRKETAHNTVDEHDGVIVRIIPSIGTHCTWSARMGYLNNRAADAFMYDKDRGLVGQFVAPVRTHSV